MTEKERDRWHEMVNEVSDLCNTSYVNTNMSWDEVVDFFNDILHKITAELRYPPDEDHVA